ncbi:MAG TPA: hypothetical protein VKA26_12715 [Ignavibacteriaceae bacterium]|nr:hypothetical protein [Ignavibacteriaceae bacterium]
MLLKIIDKLSSAFLISTLAFAFIICNSESPAQSLWKINSTGPGGSGSNNTTIGDDSSNPTKAIIIVAGLAVGGYLLYKYVLNPETDEDTTYTEDNASILVPKNSIFYAEMTSLAKAQKSGPPVNVYLGVSRDYYINREETYVLGVSFNF